MLNYRSYIEKASIMMERFNEQTTSKDKEPLGANELIKEKTNNNWEKILWVNNSFNYKNVSVDVKRELVIWINSKGKICYKVNIFSDDECLSINEANNAISNILNTKIKFIHSNIQQRDNTQKQKNSTIKIPLSLFKIAYKEAFMPNSFQEFFLENNSWIKNRFAPSNFMIDDLIMQYGNHLPPKNVINQTSFQYSVTVEFIYQIVGCNQEKFLYILNWLAAFFQAPANRSNIALVFVGKDNWAINFLFHKIISELFRREYCLQIDTEMLELKGLFKLLEEKLFYYFEDIRINDNNRFNIKNLIKDIITKNEFYTQKNSCYPKKFKNYGQTIIATDNPNIPFLEKDGDYYTVFKATPVNDDIIKKLTDDYKIHFNTFHNSVFELILDRDFKNFANILKSWIIDRNLINKPLINDDRNILVQSLNDKVQSFAKAVVNKDTNFFDPIKDINKELHNELVYNFRENIFMQPNLIRCFNILYSEEEDMIQKSEKDKKYKTRRLMKMLKKVDGEFFSKENIFVNSAGLKYFKYR